MSEDEVTMSLRRYPERVGATFQQAVEKATRTALTLDGREGTIVPGGDA